MMVDDTMPAQRQLPAGFLEGEGAAPAAPKLEGPLGAFGAMSSLDGAPAYGAAPLSPPPGGLSIEEADGGVDSAAKAGGASLVTDEQRAVMMLLQDPVSRECAARLERLRGATDAGRNALAKNAAADFHIGATGAIVAANQESERQRLKRMKQLENQLERALQNQRRYVLGRAGLGHLAEGLVHLQGLGRLAETSAWVPPGEAGLTTPWKTGAGEWPPGALPLSSLGELFIYPRQDFGHSLAGSSGHILTVVMVRLGTGLGAEGEWAIPAGSLHAQNRLSAAAEAADAEDDGGDDSGAGGGGLGELLNFKGVLSPGQEPEEVRASTRSHLAGLWVAFLPKS